MLFSQLFCAFEFFHKKYRGKRLWLFSFPFFFFFDTGSHVACDFKKNVSPYGGYLRVPDALPEDQSSVLSTQRSSVIEQLTTNYSLSFRWFSTFLCPYRCTRAHTCTHVHRYAFIHKHIFLILKPSHKSQTLRQLLTSTIPAEGVSCCCIRLRLEQTRPAESLEPALKWGRQNLRASTML